MARKRITSETEHKAPKTGVSDPLLAAMDKYVLETLDDPNASKRDRANAASIGLKLLQVKKVILGDDNGDDFFPD